MNKENRSDSVGAFFSAYLWLKRGADSTDFLDRIGIPIERRIYVSRYSSTVIALIKKEELLLAQNESDFIEYSEYSFEIPQSEACEIILGQIGADTISGTNSPQENLSGNGVRVGVISAENEIFDSEAKSLEGVKIEVLETVFPPKIDVHPTAVVSQIIGNPLTVDGVRFMGVVRNATLYFAPTKTVLGVYRAIERMLDEGVSIINYSAGIRTNGEYSDFDRQIDRLILENDFLFITSSGNVGRLTSPAMAWGGVSVGNLETKSGPFEERPLTWSTKCIELENCSGFNMGRLTPHKPDVVAPGEFVPFVDRNGGVVFSSGTSFASPLVLGVATALIEKSEGRYSYLTIKALLILSSDDSVISPINNPTIPDSPFIRERTGYGLVSASVGVSILERANIFEGRFGEENTFETSSVEGKDIEIAFVFEKRENSSPSLLFEGESFSAGVQNTLVIKRRSKGNSSPLSVYGAGDGRFSVVVL